MKRRHVITVEELERYTDALHTHTEVYIRVGHKDYPVLRMERNGERLVLCYDARSERQRDERGYFVPVST